jgi:hypothetical protein
MVMLVQIMNIGLDVHALNAVRAYAEAGGLRGGSFAEHGA